MATVDSFEERARAIVGNAYGDFNAIIAAVAAALTALETANEELRRDHDSIIAATKSVGIEWRENEDGAEIAVNMSAARYQAYADVLMDQGEAIARERDALKAEVERLRGELEDTRRTWKAELEETATFWQERAATSAEAVKVVEAAKRLLIEREATERIYEEAYHFVFKNQGRPYWDALVDALAAYDRAQAQKEGRA